MLTKMRLDMPLTDEDFLANKENEQIAQLADKDENEKFTDVLMNDDDLFEIYSGSASVSHQATSSSEISVCKKFSSSIFKFRILLTLKCYICLYLF